MDAFDADLLIFAASGDSRGAMLQRALDVAAPSEPGGMGSVLLVPETLTLSATERGLTESSERRRLIAILSRLQLHPVTRSVAERAAVLRIAYRLRTADAVHLATAIGHGADRFVTNNRKDFHASITEIDIVHPT